MSFFQKEIALPFFSRGFHLITEIIKEEFTVISQIKIGVLHVFIKHISALDKEYTYVNTGIMAAAEK